MAISRTPEEEQVVREKMLAICANEFLREGYENTSMKSLSRAANCTTGKFYSNFSGKLELLKLLCQKIIRASYREASSMMQEDEPRLMKFLYGSMFIYESCRLKIGRAHV